MPQFIRDIELTSFVGVELRIYTIGYSRQGETILLLLCQGDNILFSILTDCFQKHRKGVPYFDALDDIFANYKEPRIDAFIWTHPDLDHSVGIRNVLGKFDPTRECLVYIPATLDRKLKYGNCKHANDAFEYLLDTYGERVDAIGIMDRTEQKCIEASILDLSSGLKIHIDGFFLAPSSSLLLQRSYREKTFKMNDLSIVYSLSINGRNLLFTGDVEGTNINRLCNTHLQNLIFHKIPHHGSNHSSQLSNKLLALENFDVTQTVTQKGSTPNVKELAAYKNLGEIWVASDDTISTYNYGVVCMRYDLRSMQLIGSPQTNGNAHKL